MAKRRLPDLADDHRCTRNGTNWRCHLPRLPNKSYCHKHHLFNLSRSQSKSKTKPKPQSLTQLQSFNPNTSNLREIWAFHQHGAPNLYALIDRVVPTKSLVEATPLVPSSSNFSCGFFRSSDSNETIELSRFSHRVWFEVEGDQYKILPRKGEVWAVERYNWVEMMSSFGDGEGASGLVLDLDNEGAVYRRRLHEGCELVRRFSMEEVSMFMYRVAFANIVGGLGMLEGCTIVVEEERETSIERLEATHHQSEVQSDSLIENNTKEQAPDHSGNQAQNAQTLEGISNNRGIDANVLPLRQIPSPVTIAQGNPKGPVIWNFGA